MTYPSNSAAAESSHKRVEFLKRTTRFPNLRAGGRELALQPQMYSARADSIVMGIALGGIHVAHEVAILRRRFDLVLILRGRRRMGRVHRSAINVTIEPTTNQFRQ